MDDPSIDQLRRLAPGVECAVLARSRRLWSGEPDTFTLTAVHDGASVWRTGGVERLTTAGGVRLKRPGGHFRTVSAPEPSMMTVLRLSPATLRRLGPPHAPAAFDAAQLDDRRVFSAIVAVGRRDDDDDVDDAVLHLLACLAEHAARPVPAPGRRGSRADVAGVRALIDRHYAEPLPLQRLADEAGLHATTLVRLFRREYGVPPHAYLIERRIEAAQALFTRGELDAATVAHRVGFCDQSHLNRHFKRRTGTTPVAFARQERVGDGAAPVHRPR